MTTTPALNLAAAKIVTPEGQHDQASINVRNGTATLRTRRGTSIGAPKAGVVAVESLDPGKGWAKRRGSGSFVVRFDDGTEWAVERQKVRCGSCGG